MKSGSWLGRVLVALLLVTRLVHADDLVSTLGQRIHEVSHSVEISVHAGVAKYVVRRVFANPGERSDEASLTLDLPYGAAATGLRIRARKMWHSGKLMEATKAAELYQELTGLGAFQAQDPALLQWMWADKLHLQVFPVVPAQTSTVEYTLTAPTRYRNGKILLAYPRPANNPALVAPVLRLLPSHGDNMTWVRVDGERVAPDNGVVLKAPSDESASDGAITSELLVAGAGSTREIQLDVDITHSYQGDLTLTLLTPTGVELKLHERSGSGSNDIQRRFTHTLPKETPISGTWSLLVQDHAGLDTGTLNSWQLELKRSQAAGAPIVASSVDTPRFIPDAPEADGSGQFVEIEVAAEPIDKLALRLGAVTASPQKSLSRFELDAAPALSTLPRRPAVVFVLDASRSVDASMGPDAVQLQIAIARAYLAHVPDAQVEFVVVRRRVARLFGEFLSVKALDVRLAALLAAGLLEPGNGSSFELGVALAGQALTGRAGPRRIVAFSDMLHRKALAARQLVAAAQQAPSAAILHLVQPRGGADLQLVRDDEHELFRVAKARGGIFARLEGLPAETPKQLGPAVLELVRPTRLEHFRILGPNFDEEVPTSLPEGSALRLWASSKLPSRQATVEGQLWSSVLRRSVYVDASFSRATAAFAFGEDRHQDFSQAEMLKVAWFGRAVSPVTSYLAVEPGTRPSIDGIVRGGELALSGVGYGGGGRGAGVGIRMAAPNLVKLLQASATRCAAQLQPAAGWFVALDVETTFQEVVDVAAASAPSPMSTCIEEAAWALQLGEEFRLERDQFRVEFPVN